ncbi:predicted protein [Plenodomus lingam JN3]|uniref:Predicted protein n=1 Tax=Leptosphaeria maculans (strain JN3 / isolate v23.1.3 / race Av1-4-5-6-7-8) TaxID=985895 RepID=E4ZHI9_LEPMJ|nr:predicted protein [Plenodomus lingam JN3]CBX90822.1 predicted protein [Plenodomus lingam JN3]
MPLHVSTPMSLRQIPAVSTLATNPSIHSADTVYTAL